MGWNCSAHVLSCWCSTGLLFLCLMSCWWLDSILFILSPVGARRDFCFFVQCRVGGSTRFFSSSVLLVLDGTFVSLFNVVLVARLDFFHLKSCWCSKGLLFLCLMTQHIASARPCEWVFDYSYWLQPCVFMFGAAEEDPLEQAPHQSSQPTTTIF